MSWAGKMFFLANKLDSSFIFCTLTHELHFFHNLVFAVCNPSREADHCMGSSGWNSIRSYLVVWDTVRVKEMKCVLLFFFLTQNLLKLLSSALGLWPPGFP